MMPKRAYVVVGPESSGNRLLTALLVRAGCAGAGSTSQPFDLPTEEDPAVLLRSYPHGNEWPDLAAICGELRNRGYVVRVLVLVRDPWCVVQSQRTRQQHPEQLAWANIRHAYTTLFGQLAPLNIWWTLVPYEALVLHPVEAVRRLLEMIDLPAENLEGPFEVDGLSRLSIEDANAAHYDSAGKGLP